MPANFRPSQGMESPREAKPLSRDNFFRKESGRDYDQAFSTQPAKQTTYASQKRLTPLGKRPSGESSPTATPAQNGVNVGGRIRHDRFGVGTIVEINGEGDNCRFTIKFDNVGRKQLLQKYARFTSID